MKDYWELSNGYYIVKLNLKVGIDSEMADKNTMPSHFGSFILSNSKRIINNFLRIIDGFKTNNIYNQDTDSLYKKIGTNLLKMD